MGYNALASRMDIQNSYVDTIIMLILNQLKKGQVDEAVQVMSDLGISSEVFKEHVLQLCMDPKLVKGFEDIDSGVKSALTRSYNKQNQANTTGVVKKKAGKKTGQPSSQPNTEEIKESTESGSDDEADDEEELDNDEDEDGDELLNEEEIAEKKKGKVMMKKDAQKSKLEKAKKFELL